MDDRSGDTPPSVVTQLLVDWSRGDPGSLHKLMPLVYDELHRLADRSMRRERGSHTLQPTAVVNEAFLRLVDQRVEWKSRAQFFAVAAQAMRRILVDHARGHDAAKRGGRATRVLLDESLGATQPRDVDFIALDDALDRLGALDETQARVVELRFFGGLTIEETAAAMELSPATVKRDWSSAKAWLFRELSGAPR
ncbi:MAG: sigma-70 family RNA polymerase sigma factor [Thermoanaerobaculia bacterium]